MNHLKKVILVNSWVKGRINQFEVDGGCVIQGGNGAGKTSTLILPLLFFGARPSDVMKASKKSNSFASRYLPTTSSYVVFEYQKENETFLVIVHSQESDSLIYQFCEGSFEESLFIEGDNKFVDHADIKHHLQSIRNRKVSRQFKWAQYQDVIQSNKQVRGRDKESRSINEAKAKYSICSPNQSISGAEKVAVSIISSSPSFQSIKELISLEIESFGESVREQLDTRHNDSNLQTQANVLRQAKGFLGKRDMVLDLKSYSSLIDAWGSELGEQRFIAETSLMRNESEKEALSAEIEKLDNERETLEKEYESESRILVDRIGTIQGQVGELNRTISRTEKTYQKYQEEGIDERRKEALKIESYVTELEHLNIELDALQGKYDQIINLYSNRLAQIDKTHSELVSKERELLSGNIKAQNSLRDDLYQEKSEQLQAISESHSKEIESRNGAYSKAKVEEQRLKSSQKSPSTPELTRLTKERISLQSVKDSLIESNSTYLSEKSRFSKLSSNAQLDAVRLNGNIDKKSTDLLGAQDEIEDYKTSLRNVESMLFFRIAELSQEKADLASRALSTKLLKNPVTDTLSIQNDDNLILGIEIDLDGIEPQPILDKTELEQKLTTLYSLEHHLKQELSTLNEDLNTFYTQQKKFDAEVIRFGLELKKVAIQLEKSKQDLLQNKQEFDIEIKRFEAYIEEQICDNKTNMSEIETQLVTIKGRQSKEHSTLSDDFDKRINDTKAEIQLLEDAFNSFEEKESKRLAEEKEAIEQKKQADLNEAGARTDAIEQCRVGIKTATDNWGSAKASKDAYEKYQAWYSTEYETLDSRKKERLSLSQSLAGFNGEKTALTTDFDLNHGRIKSSLVEKNKRLQQSIAEISVLRPLISSVLSDYAVKQTDVEGLPPADKIESKVYRLKADVVEKDKHGRKLFQNIMAVLRNSSNEELFKICKELLNQEGFHELDSAVKWQALTISLEYLMDGTITEHIGTIRQDFLAKSQSLSGLDAKLDETSKKIEDAGRRISRQFNDSGTQFSNIEKLEARISSNIETVGFRKSLKAATKAFENIKYLSQHDEVPDEYYELVSNAIRDIGRFGRGLDVSQFINIEVRVKNTNVEQPRVARNDKELEGVSSEGLSFLILLSLYIAINNVIQKNEGTQLLWSIDELGKLHHDNIGLLMDILKKEKIDFLCANPSTHPKVLSSFKHIYEIKEGGRIIKVESNSQNSSKNLFLQAAKGAVHG